MSKIVLGYSGGIDSTYSARKLKNEGNEVLLVYMNNDIENNTEKVFFEGLEKGSKSLGCKLEIINYKDVFKENIADYLINYYLKGLTPNPCIKCNYSVKFKLLNEIKEKYGFDKIATGHYANIIEYNGKKYLAKPLDNKKDQTYMLYKLNWFFDKQGNSILNNLIFCLNNKKKDEIKEILIKNNIYTVNKKESQNICFLPNNDYTRFIKQNYHKQISKGPIFDKNGNYLGEHKGIIFYTIGQRHGLNFNKSEKKYVIKINHKDNSLIIGDEKDILIDKATIKELKIIENSINEKDIVNEKIYGKLRYHHLGETIKDIKGNEIFFKNNIRAITPGQHCVIYKKTDNYEIVIGGGEIL